MDQKQTQCSEDAHENGLSEPTRPLHMNLQISGRQKCPESGDFRLFPSRPTSDFGFLRAALDQKQTQCSEDARENGLSEATRPLHMNLQIPGRQKCPEIDGLRLFPSRSSSNFGFLGTALDQKQTQCSEDARENGLSEATRPLPLNLEIPGPQKRSKRSEISNKSVNAKRRRANVNTKVIHDTITVRPLNNLYSLVQHDTESASI
jgi:hypothetical protein